ncbi:MAG: cyclase family protein [Myxococcales bacterium]|nr:cyclase family protein [Myxococcales bacterium]
MRARPAIDITLPLSSATVVYPGDPHPQIRRLSDIESGAILTSSEIHLNCHVGTHIDAPAHFIHGGATVDKLPMSCFVGRAVVLDLKDSERQIRPEHLDMSRLADDCHILIKTSNSKILHEPSFAEAYSFLAPETVEKLLSVSPRSLGFDYYSIDPYETTTFPSHMLMAKAGLPVYVCLDLNNVTEGIYEFVGLPLRLLETEASPVRAILFQS